MKHGFNTPFSPWGAAARNWQVRAVAVLGLLAVLFLGSGTASAAQDDGPVTLAVQVRDAETGMAVDGAEVTFAGNVVKTGSDGSTSVDFRLDLTRKLSIDAPGYLVATRFLSRAEQEKLISDGQALVIDLKPFESLQFDFRLKLKGTSRPLRNLNSAKLTLLGKTYDISSGRLELDLDYLKARTRATLGGESVLKVEAEGYKTIETPFPLDAVAEAQRRTRPPLKLEIPLEELPGEDRIRLNFNLNDSGSNPIFGASATVRINGFGAQTTSSGNAVFRLARGDLVRFRDRFQDFLSVEVRADGFQGPATRNLPIADVIDAMDQGKDALDVVIGLKRTPAAAPSLRFTVTPDRSQVSAGDTVIFRYRIENDGNVALSSVSVRDPACSPSRYLSGDANGNGNLDPAEVWMLECRRTIQSDISGRVNVQGTAPDGSLVQANASVSVTVNACPPPRIEMPDVRGLERDYAEDILRRAGFERVLESTVESDDLDPGRVLDQTPLPGECRIAQHPVVIVTAQRPPPPGSTDGGGLRASLECPDGLEIAPGARPSRTCGVIVRGWTYNDEHVRLRVINPGAPDLDVWPMEDAAWPPNMANPGVADLRFKQRYIFTLFFSASETASPGVDTVTIIVTQGASRVELTLDVSILPAGQMPSQGSGIRPPAAVAAGSGGDYCVWRSKSFGDPPPCFKFNIAECGTEPYAGSSKYELVGNGMTKLEASARMSQLSRYGDDAYGCLDWKQPAQPGGQGPGGPPQPPPPEPEPTRTCSDGSVLPRDLPCPGEADQPPEGPESTRTCPDGSVVPVDVSCPTDGPGTGGKTCPDGTRVSPQEACPEEAPPEDGDDEPDTGQLDCSIYGPHAELYWDQGQQEHLCRCKAGYDFHASDRCVPTEELGQCLEYPGTFPSGNFCECTQPRHYWSAQAGRCVPESEIPASELVDCSAYPGTLPERDAATGEYYCTCAAGTKWSDSLNRCATGSEERVATLDCSNKPGTVPEMDYYLNQPVCRCPGTGETWSESDGACIDTSVAQNPGNQPNPPAPTTVQQGQCNDTAKSGSDEAVRVQVEIGGAQSVSLTYDTLNKEDRVRAFIDGTLVHDSGCVGTGGDVTTPIQAPANARLMEVDVYPNCTGGTGTRWNFVVACDQPAN